MDYMSNESLTPKSDTPNISLEPIQQDEHIAEKSYLQCCLEHTREKWREHPKVELIAAFFGGLIGIAFALIIGGFTLYGFLLAVLLAIIGLLATLGALWLIYLALSPRQLHEKQKQEIEKQTAIIAELNIQRDAVAELEELKNKHKEDIQNLTKASRNHIEIRNGQISVLNAQLEWNKKDLEREKSLVSQLRTRILQVQEQESNLQTKLNSYEQYKLTVTVRQDGIEAQAKYDEIDFELNILIHANLRFENSDEQPRAVKGLRMSIISKNEDNGNFEEIAVSTDHINWKHGKPLSISGRNQTDNIHIDFYFSNLKEQQHLINDKCLLRISMEAMLQPTYSIDLSVDWEKVLHDYRHDLKISDNMMQIIEDANLWEDNSEPNK